MSREEEEMSERLLGGAIDTNQHDQSPLPSAPPNLLPFTREEHHLTEERHAQARRLLYVSHLLSTWNSRLFEFGAFLFLANIYPQNLLPASVYALARAASAATFSPWLGSYIDRTNRLSAVRTSIVGQRVAVASSCVVLFLMTQLEILRKDFVWSSLLLAILACLACVEKLSWVLNTVSVERDWVVIVADGHEERLRSLNSQMRRIDLFCKLIGPLAISFIDGASSRIAILVMGGMTVISVLVEYFTIVKAYHIFPALGAPKDRRGLDTRPDKFCTASFKAMLSGGLLYVRHEAFLPSFSLALLYLTVLSFAGQMITYLVALGLSSGSIGVLRAVSAVFELSATWLAPKVMNRIGPIRAGIWFLNWEIACVAIACVFFWMDTTPSVAAVGTICAVIVSRIGLWGFDLSAQIIVQEEVEQENRGTFSSQEFALQNVFEMLAFASTIMFPRPGQFKYPAAISAAAVALAGALYAVFVRSRRGHLIHLSKCVDSNGRHKDHSHWWTRVPQEEASEI